MTAWLRADEPGGVDVLLDVNLSNVARLAGRATGPGDADPWVLEVTYLSGGSDVIYAGTRAEVADAREAIFAGFTGAGIRRIDLAGAIDRRRNPRDRGTPPPARQAGTKP